MNYPSACYTCLHAKVNDNFPQPLACKLTGQKFTQHSPQPIECEDHDERCQCYDYDKHGPVACDNCQHP